MFTLKKLILEAEDDFNVTPGGEWNVETLSVGDEITPDMWNKTSDSVWNLPYTDKNKTYKIKEFVEDWEGYDGSEWRLIGISADEDYGLITSSADVFVDYGGL